MSKIPNSKIEYIDDYIVTDIFSEKLCIPKTCTGIGEELLEFGVHEVECLPAYLSLVKKRHIVLEVGANIGYYTVLTGRNLNNTGYMYCIEPVSESCTALAKTIELNGYTNAKIYNLAIADYVGEIEIDICSGSNLTTAIATMPDSMSEGAVYNLEQWETSKRSVKCTTLDRFVQSNCIGKIDMLRMDIEGFETKAIAGAHYVLEKLMKRGSCFFLEIHPVYHKYPEEEYKDMIEYIMSLGFVPYRDIRWHGKNLDCLPTIWEPEEMYQEGGFGYVFLVKER